jgi:TOBE domain
VEVLVRLNSGEDVTARIARHAARYQLGDAVQLHWNPAEEMKFS